MPVCMDHCHRFSLSSGGGTFIRPRSKTDSHIVVADFDSKKQPRSPFTRDRFLTAASPGKENVQHELEHTQKRSTPSTPSKQRKPRILGDKVLDAPGLSDLFPSKLIDINANNILGVALGTSVYIWRDGNTEELLSTDGMMIDSVCWVGDHLALSGGGHIELWDVNKSTTIQSFKDHRTRVGCLASYQDVLATGGDDGVIHISDRRGKEAKTIDAHDGQVSSLSWSLDGATLASGGVDGCVKLWGTTKHRKYHHESCISGMAWLPSSVLVTGESSGDGLLTLFQTRSHEKKLVCTGKPITGVSYSPQWGIIVGHDDEDGTWEMWSSDASTCISEFQTHSQGIVDLCYEATTDTVVTVSKDETLRMWHLDQPMCTPRVQQTLQRRASAMIPKLPYKQTHVSLTPVSLR